MNGLRRRRGSAARRSALAVAAAAGAAATLSFVPATVHAAAKVWNTTATQSNAAFNWSTSGNWTTAGQPVTGDTVTLAETDAFNRTVVFDASVTAASISALTIDASGTGLMTLQIPLGSTKTLNLTGAEIIGSTATTGHGTFQQDGGTHIVGAGLTLTLANNAASTGSYFQTAGAATFANVNLGNLGSGVYTQSGGTVSINGAGASDGLSMATQGGSVGSWLVNGGTMTVTATTGVTVGKLGTSGLFDQSAGTVTIGGVGGANNRNVVIATDPASTGNYTVEGTGVTTVNGGVYVGGSNLAAGGAGTFLVDAATATITGTLKIWNTSGTSAAIHNGGTLNVGSIDVGGHPELLDWQTGTLNFTASGLSLDPTSPLGSSLALPDGKILSLAGALAIPAGSDLTMEGGGLTATALTGAGIVDFNSGNVTLTNSGITIDSNQLLGSSISLPVGSSLIVSGPLVNNGTTTMAGGTLGGASALTNAGVISGNGTIIGGGGITNTGLVMLSGGNLTISKTGTFANNTGGIIQLDAGRQLQLNGGDLQNDGTLDLDGGGTINSTGAAQLFNNTEGLITGSGTISVPLINAGTVAITAGTLNTGAFTNTGIVQLGGITSKISVSGGGLTNAANGIIQGVGRVSATLNNLGRVEAVGGTLTLAGNTTNANGALLAAGSGTTILTIGTLQPNQGTISLTGGTFDTNHQVLTNAATGIISGRGTIRASSIVNNGQIMLAGGESDVQSTITGNSGSKVILSGGGDGFFYQPVTMNAGSELRVGTNSTAAFFGNVNGSSFFTGFGTKDFESGVSNVQALITSGSTEVQGGATLNTTVIRENSLALTGNATVAANGGPSATSNLGALTIASPGQLDLKNNDLVVRSGSIGSFVGGSYTGVTGLLQSGRNGGTWNGSGIVSSSISGSLTSLGVATAEQAGVANSTWSGQQIQPGNILVMYTYGGDANLDGKINVDDYGIIDFNVGIQGAPLLSGSAATSLSGVSAVPEPTAAAGLLLLSAVTLVGKRRRQSRR